MNKTQKQEDAKDRLFQAIVDKMVPYEVQLKLHRCQKLTYDESVLVAEANHIIGELQNMFARMPCQGTLTTNESVRKIIREFDRGLKTHITSHTKISRKLLNYFAQNIEIDQNLNEYEKSDIRVRGIKLQMREVACTLIDDYDALPVKAADAVFEHFSGKPDAYDNKLSFRTTVYKHYEISRGCKPEIKANSIRNLKELVRIIPILL